MNERIVRGPSWASKYADAGEAIRILATARGTVAAENINGVRSNEDYVEANRILAAAAEYVINNWER
jgi:hypothetical protein